MNQDYLKTWTLMANEMNRPIRDLMNLNMKTLRNVKVLKLEEFSEIRQPSDLIGKEINLVLENSHKLLDYMEESFHIIEDAFLAFSQEMKQNTEKTMKQAESEISHNQSFYSREMKSAENNSQPDYLRSESNSQKQTSAPMFKSTASRSASASRSKPAASSRSASASRSKPAASSRSASASRSKPAASSRSASASRSKSAASSRSASASRSKPAVSSRSASASHSKSVPASKGVSFSRSSSTAPSRNANSSRSKSATPAKNGSIARSKSVTSNRAHH